MMPEIFGLIQRIHGGEDSIHWVLFISSNELSSLGGFSLM